MADKCIKRPGLAPAIVQPPEADCLLSPSNTKQPRVWEPNGADLSTNDFPATTILDVLNAHCWRLVLDYVSVRDVVRSERVSRGWQRVVRDYLAGVYKYQIINLYGRDSLWGPPPRMSVDGYRVIQLSKNEFFESMIQKMGPFVSMLAVTVDKDRLEAIAANCPNLKHLKIRLLWTEPHQIGIFNNCKLLKQLSIRLNHEVDDSSLNEIITIETLEELEITTHTLLTGSFLTNLRANLKYLRFYMCRSLEFENILSIADRLTGLTRLELNRNPISVLQKVHLLLDKTPNLECLGLEEYVHPPSVMDRLIEMGSELPTAIARLIHLKELSLRGNKAVTNEWLEIVARGCPALRAVNVGVTYVGARGLRALCRAKPDLVELVISSTSINDQDAEACARHCVDLELLDVSSCCDVTARLPGRLARPRTRPLRLRMSGSLAENIEVHYDGITLLWNEPCRNFWPEKYVLHICKTKKIL